ncbi:hypothetical protein JZO82_14960 [Vagococcus fluvialis]|jgi:hypothetical protein|uniref:hypothetical protein n=1 Tax=Vagococcus fluvialis TaxID=2738 RepID=UPI001A8C90A7|nr:hypothetical protein [Vagococcus fluvialis]MBO0430466.1 hypothetical protein [Vagococcus fluvialis]
MVEVFFHNLTDKENDLIQLHSLPRVGDTLGLAPSEQFFLVKGVTQNKFDTEKHLRENYEYEVYAVRIGQSEWVKSLR